MDQEEPLANKRTPELTPQQQEDLQLIEMGRKVAELLGFGYKVVGAGPGVLLASDQLPRYSIDLPENVVRRLSYIADSLPKHDGFIGAS